MNESEIEAMTHNIKNASNTHDLAAVAYGLGLAFGRGVISYQERKELSAMLEKKWEELKTLNKD